MQTPYAENQSPNNFFGSQSSKLPALTHVRLYEVNSITRAKSYGMGLESQNYWVEKPVNRSSSINRSSVPYNILTNGKNQTSGKLGPVNDNLREHKKESVSKFADLQNTYHHRKNEIHKVC